MAVLHKLQRHTFTVVDNAALTDDRLSWKATGLLAFLLSRPDDWSVKASDLANRKTDGRDSVLSGMKELEDAGYLRREKRQSADGKWSTIVYVAESPELLKEMVDQPTLDIPVSDDSPITENPTVGKPVPLPTTEDQVLKSDLLTTFVDHAPRDEIWDTLIEIFEEPTNDNTRGKRNKAVKLLRQSRASPDEIRVRVRAWPLHFPDATLTDIALANHWDELGRPPARASKADIERFETEVRMAEGELRARRLDRGLPA